MKRALALIVGLVVCLAAQSEEVITFVQTKGQNSSPKPYLKENAWLNEGYISVRVTFQDIEGANCITPTKSGGLSSYFWKQESEVVIAARLWGFKGIAADKWFPLASYQWDNNGKFCRTFFQPAILLVPPTPLVPVLVSDTPGQDPDQPYIVISMRTTSKDEEKISSTATSLLKIAGGLATGGAASTVTGLVNFTGGPIVKVLSDEFNKAFSSRSEQVYKIPLTWDQLAKGYSTNFDMISITRKSGFSSESVDAAIARGRASENERRTLMRVTLNFDLRRSVFYSDTEAAPPNYLLNPTDPRLSPRAVLNYPRDAPIEFARSLASVNQFLSADLPELSTRLKQSDFVAQCGRFVGQVTSAGFNSTDSALVIAAALTEAKDGWNNDPAFYRVCLPDQAIRKAIALVMPNGFINPAGAVPEVEESIGQRENGITNSHMFFMAELKRALLKNGSQRDYELRALFNDLPESLSWPDLAQFQRAAEAAAIQPPSRPGDGDTILVSTVTEASALKNNASPLSSIAIAKVGCLESFPLPPDSNPAIAITILADTVKGLQPFVLAFELRPDRLNKSPVAGAISRIATWSDEKDLITIYGYGKFREGTLCHSTDASKLPPALRTK